jgi:predicted RND superfamily exporter protein
MWNYDLDTFEADTDILETLNNYGSRETLEGVLGGAKFNPTTGKLVSAEALSISYFLKDRSQVENGASVDPINEAWEESVFLETVQNEPMLDTAYLSSRSFSDEFGGEISGDVLLVNISYIVAFAFLGATLGTKLCGRGSRWAMAFSTLVLIAMATVAGFGVASLAGLIYGPVHSILPFVLLGIGVDDAFVIANAFDREREGVPRESEDDESLIKRGAKSLARAGASITVTSLTDLVAFAISSTSSLPALSSFCAFASINILFLWALAASFFTATMVIDEKRQRANKRDCLCCLTRQAGPDEIDTGSKEGRIPTYFRKYHAPRILSKPGKAATLLFFAGLFGFGVYGFINLPVEDSARNFIPEDSYIKTYASTSDEYFPTSGTSLYITFEGGGEGIYKNRDKLATLDTRLTGLSEAPPYIAEPNSDSTYQNVMAGMKEFLSTSGAAAGLNITLGDDGWPTTHEDFVKTLKHPSFTGGVGAKYRGDVTYDDATGDIQAYRVKLEYIRMTKTFRGEVIEDASRQIEAMDATRTMVNGWTDLQPAFPYSEQFVAIESFKLIGDELYRNVGLSILCVGIIVLVTVANFVTASIITLNVAFCIIEILGFMYAIGIVIDSVSVINIVLAVGLSIDYSAHIGHCFMVKGGDSRDARATEALADMGSSVLNGGLSTFLAVAVLLFSKSFVFKTLSTQFALTVGLGIIHGLVLLPVLLSLIGPKPFASAEPPHEAAAYEIEVKNPSTVEVSDHPEDGAGDKKDRTGSRTERTAHAESMGFTDYVDRI